MAQRLLCSACYVLTFTVYMVTGFIFIFCFRYLKMFSISHLLHEISRHTSENGRHVYSFKSRDVITKSLAVFRVYFMVLPRAGKSIDYAYFSVKNESTRLLQYAFSFFQKKANIQRFIGTDDRLKDGSAKKKIIF